MRSFQASRISAKTGEGVPELLDALVERIPAPEGDEHAQLGGRGEPAADQ